MEVFDTQRKAQAFREMVIENDLPVSVQKRIAEKMFADGLDYQGIKKLAPDYLTFRKDLDTIIRMMDRLNSLLDRDSNSDHSIIFEDYTSILDLVRAATPGQRESLAFALNILGATGFIMLIELKGFQEIKSKVMAWFESEEEKHGWKSRKCGQPSRKLIRMLMNQKNKLRRQEERREQ